MIDTKFNKIKKFKKIKIKSKTVSRRNQPNIGHYQLNCNFQVLSIISLIMALSVMI